MFLLVVPGTDVYDVFFDDLNDLDDYYSIPDDVSKYHVFMIQILLFCIPPLVLVTFAAPISHCCCRKGSMRHNTDLPSQGRAEWLMRISTSFIAASLLGQLLLPNNSSPYLFYYYFLEDYDDNYVGGFERSYSDYFFGEEKHDLQFNIFAVVIAPLLFWAEASYWENRDPSLFRKIFSTEFFRNMFQSSEVSSDVLNKGLVISWVTYFSGIIISTLMLNREYQHLGSFFATISWIPMLIHVEKSKEHRNKERSIVTAHDALMLPQGLDVEVDSENMQDSDAQTNSERFRRSCANRLRLASISFFVISFLLPFLRLQDLKYSMISSAIAFYLSYEAIKMYTRESGYCIFQHYFTMFVAFLSFAIGTSLIIPESFDFYDNNSSNSNVGSFIILTFNNLMIWCPMFLHTEFAREIASNDINVESPSSPIPEPIDQDDVQHLSQAAQELEGLVSDRAIDQQQREEMLDKNMFSILFATEPWTRSFFVAILVFLFQVIIYGVIGIELLGSLQDPSFAVPVGGSPLTTKIAQIIALVVSLMTQTDFIRALDIFCNKNILHSARLSVTILQRKVANSMCLVQGILSLFISFLIVIGSSEIIVLFADFAAMTFISNLDEIIFWLARQGYIFHELKDKTIEVENLKFSSNNKRRQIRQRVLFSLVLLLWVIGWFIAISSVNETHLLVKFDNNEDDYNVIEGSKCDGRQVYSGTHKGENYHLQYGAFSIGANTKAIKGWALCIATDINIDCNNISGEDCQHLNLQNGSSDADYSCRQDLDQFTEELCRSLVPQPGKCPTCGQPVIVGKSESYDITKVQFFVRKSDWQPVFVDIKKIKK